MHHKARPGVDSSPSCPTSRPASVSRIHSKTDDVVEPVGASAHRASMARVYDALLGGKDNYAIDRAAAAMVLAAHPDANHLFHTENEFRIRACRYLVSIGLRQFLVFGSRLSQQGNDPHDVVHRTDRDSRVVYADNDPLVLAHWRALMYAPNDTMHVAEVNPFDTSAVLSHPEIAACIDFDDPVAVIHVGTWPYCGAPRDRSTQMMAELIDALAPGSWLTLRGESFPHPTRSLSCGTGHGSRAPIQPVGRRDLPYRRRDPCSATRTAHH
jgi:S-adenosyl methyltransferase